MTTDSYRDYGYHNSDERHSHAYLWPVVERLLRTVNARCVFEIGCGNGWVAREMATLGLEVVATDPSASGIAYARSVAPAQGGPKFEQASAYEDLADRFGIFDLVVSLEVIEHLYAPRRLMESARALLPKKGHVLLSTPYHGYWKCLAIALLGKTDSHYSPLWEGGHIKFWSANTISQLCADSGFKIKHLVTCGRIPPFGKSMVLLAERV